MQLLSISLHTFRNAAYISLFALHLLTTTEDKNFELNCIVHKLISSPSDACLEVRLLQKWQPFALVLSLHYLGIGGS